MARGVNKVILVGNCGKDPETRFSPSGSGVTKISIATSESWRDKQSGEMQERTEWHNVVLWRGLAEVAEKYLHKGDQVYIEGKLRTRSWEKEGITRYTTEIVADNMTMLGGRTSDSMGGGDSGYSSASMGSTASTPAASTSASVSTEGMDDDLPF